ncbi:MAG: hemolysin III family protein [Bacillaceae bacterium]
MSAYIREPINALTHLAGAILAFIALIAMIIKTALTVGSGIAITAVTIFGVSMILLYVASTTYHSVIGSSRVIAFLRRLDHSMIFILIAGSYTPFCLIALNDTSGWILFSVVTGVAVIGIVFKMVWFNCPRWLSTAIYIVMGWLAVFVFTPLWNSLSGLGFFYLVLGGVLYTIGGIIYAVKPKFLEFKHLGFHEIFHIFILLGSAAHFICVYFYVL